jgi:hypothetical protein
VLSTTTAPAATAAGANSLLMLAAGGEEGDLDSLEAVLGQFLDGRFCRRNRFLAGAAGAGQEAQVI